MELLTEAMRAYIALHGVEGVYRGEVALEGWVVENEPSVAQGGHIPPLPAGLCQLRLSQASLPRGSVLSLSPPLRYSSHGEILRLYNYYVNK